MPGFDSAGLKKDFPVEYVQDVYRLQLRHWAEPPHYAIAYYAEKEETLLLTALTERGYGALAKAIAGSGLDVPDDPDIRVHLPMTGCIKNILGKELQLNTYKELFSTTCSRYMVSRLV